MKPVRHFLSLLLCASLFLSACSPKETTETRKRKKSTKKETTQASLPPSDDSAFTDETDPSESDTDVTDTTDSTGFTTRPHATTSPSATTNAAGRTAMSDIADLAWAKSTYPIFECGTPEQLAGAVMYINEHGCDEYGMTTITLLRDIDLDAYEWEPIDDFSGNIDGQGHAIQNIHLNTPHDGHNGLIGVNGGAIGIWSLRIENAEVTGGDYVGIFIGEGYMLNCVGIYGSGTITSDGSYVGALIGRTSPSTTYDSCTMDVTINGSPAEFISFTEENESHADEYAQELFTLTIDDTYTVTRDDIPDFQNQLGRDYGNRLSWRVIYNGTIVLERVADDEFSYQYFIKDPGKYQIYITTYNYEFQGYVRISNIAEYEIT